MVGGEYNNLYYTLHRAKYKLLKIRTFDIHVGIICIHIIQIV